MTLLELIELLKKRLTLVVALPLAFSLVAAAYCFLFMPNEYTATTSMYVLYSQSETTNVSDSSVLSASQMIANDVAQLFKSDRITRETLEATGMESLDGYDVSVQSSTTTRVITLSVTGKDPEMAARIANATVEEVSSVANEVMQIQSVNVIDSATTPTSPSGPKRIFYTAIGAAAGLVLAIVIVLLRDSLDTRIRSGEDAEAIVGVPVVGHFPAIE
jgi:capsular polysaccharide biosynthesis protein